ncbi:MAG TPA: hypothetical protein VMU88_07740, partial [bacterium]|nr:hypothetical protein [bacterium]
MRSKWIFAGLGVLLLSAWMVSCTPKDDPASPNSSSNSTATPTTTATVTSTPDTTTHLGVGDVVITAFESSAPSGPDYFYFVPLVDINPGTVIYLTDEGWDGSLSTPGFTTANTNSDSVWAWTATTLVPAGTEVVAADPPSTGAVSFVFGDHGVPGLMGLSGAEDQIFIFQADSVNASTGSIANLHL